MPLPARITDRIRKPVPAPLAPPDHYGTAEVAAMLREIGIALIEVSEPVQVVEARLRAIAVRYTTEAVQVAVLPTMLFIQIGATAHEMDGSARPGGNFDTAARVDELDQAHSGFVAAAVAIPFAVLVARIKTAPPAGMLTLAAFWSLVPGQLTFMAVSRKAAGDYLGVAGVGVAAAAIISIALGALAGWSLLRTIAGPATAGLPVA